MDAALVEEDEVEEEAVEVEATEWSDSVPSCSEPYPLSELVSMSCRSSFSTSRSTARWKSYLAPRFRTDFGGVGGSSAPAVTCGETSFSRVGVRGASRQRVPDEKELVAAVVAHASSCFDGVRGLRRGDGAAAASRLGAGRRAGGGGGWGGEAPFGGTCCLRLANLGGNCGCSPAAAARRDLTGILSSEAALLLILGVPLGDGTGEKSLVCVLWRRGLGRERSEDGEGDCAGTAIGAWGCAAP